MKRIQISLVGRPNVGKSTLVNRLAEKKVCIVGEKSGITRDRKEVEFEWEGVPFLINDTGGITFDHNDPFADDIFEQAEIALNNADAIVFLVDVNSGLTADDERICKILREKYFEKVFVAVNKVDSYDKQSLSYEFYKLGFDNLFPISAMHGSVGLNEMLESIIEKYGKDLGNASPEFEEIIKISFVGKPNVGKSSLYNKLVGEDRSIVSDVSGTTRDSINMFLNRHNSKFELIDTAGLRRKSKVHEEVERFSTLRTTHSIARSDVVILILDGTEEEIVSEQDQKIASLIESKGKACVVAINKWDILPAKIKEDPVKLEAYKNELHYKLRFISYADILYISAKEGTRTDKIWTAAIAANEQHKRRVETSLLNKVLADILMLHPPPIVKQKSIRIKYVTQVDVAPPTFLFFANFPELLPETYIRFMEKQFREYFGFKGSPILIKFKVQE
ncbi:MAG: ribosome biogenesis GTPase Der [Candidatus Caenarcaniphilales bacterium]|nr:ribosome biogenesis GTPase Der [Candidatus Caenarcaniphilales bacterium]